MNTQVAVLIAGAMVAGSIMATTAMRSDDRPQDTSSAERTSANGVAPTSGPALLSAPEDHQATRTQRDLEQAQAEIQRLKEQVAKLVARDDTATDAPAFIAKRDHFLELKEAYGAGTATKEQVTELLALSKDAKLMAFVVEGLTAQIATNPDDLDARMQLADVQSARVHSVDSITERAALGRSVGEQIKAVLERDPEHWEARYMKAVGISHSQRTPQGRANAVREFESLIAVQQARSPEARYARTYGQLAIVYLAERNIVKAREALQQGLDRYPDAKALREQFAKLPSE